LRPAPGALNLFYIRIFMPFHSIRTVFTVACLTLFLLFPGCDTKADSSGTAPDFELQNLSGDKVSLKEHRGNPVLLDFWATWCPPCRTAIPELVALQTKYRDQGLIILGISLDDPQHINDRYLEAFKEYFKINYTILRASEKVVEDYFKERELAIPTMFVIDREGRIVDVLVGFRPGAVEGSLKKIIP
jgi:cytochrome c biogenesis protein CcmG/thiol:disulfide interchange protein DsbE